MDTHKSSAGQERTRAAAICWRQFYLVWIIFVAVSGGHLLFSQTPADEHASHHAAGTATTAPSQPDVSPSSMPAAEPSSNAQQGSAAGMMGGDMGGLMQNLATPGCCGGATGKELFPWLMSLPELTPARRLNADQKANQRMLDGTALLNEGVGRLSSASATNDYQQMQTASQLMREGVEQFDSGLAARRALAEHQSPQSTALQWFRTELNLAGGTAATPQSVSLLHLFIMVSLTAFAAIMVWMYFHKMRRANALIAELAGEPGQPPTTGSPGVTPPTGAGEKSPGNSSASPLVYEGIPVAAPSKSNSWNGRLRVMRIFQETATVKTFRLAHPSGDSLPFLYLPGQFVTVTVTPQGYRARRSYTVASSPTQLEYCELTVKREPAGTVSRFLHDQIHEGDLLEVTAPSGKFTFTGQESGSVVFIAAGVGVTPFMSAIRYLTDRCWTGDIYLVYSCHEPESVIFREDLEYLQRRFANVHITWIVTDPEGKAWHGKTGHITKDLLQEAIPSLATRHVHICGPNKFMSDVKEMLAQSGVPATEIMSEIFVGKESPGAPAVAIGTAEELAGTGHPGQTPALPTLTFAKSHKVAPLSPNRSVLETAEDVGVNIDYSCRVGTCGICKTRLLAGKVTMEVDDALTAEDKAQNMILACQARSTADISVEA